MAELALILIRGMVNVQQPIKDTLSMLRLRKKHICAIVPDTPSTRGMIRIVKDLITWGEIDAATLKLLQEKRGLAWSVYVEALQKRLKAEKVLEINEATRKRILGNKS